MVDGLALLPDSWVWLIFIGIGLLMILLELIIGVGTGLDMVFLGSAFIIGGLVTWPFHSWVLTLIITLAICVAYLALGRRYVHRWTATRKELTNIDVTIGKKGIVLHRLTPGVNGLVKVGNEEWRARAEESIEKGEVIVVTAINGVTLNVEKHQGGK
ncbi:MAG: NfeD family protein [Candidatus Bathyarchaeota archaeon]|nr:NfeD family protein [Candidatus Bathyarchaeota archaeon]